MIEQQIAVLKAKIVGLSAATEAERARLATAMKTDAIAMIPIVSPLWAYERTYKTPDNS